MSARICRTRVALTPEAHAVAMQVASRAGYGRVSAWMTALVEAALAYPLDHPPSDAPTELTADTPTQVPDLGDDDPTDEYSDPEPPVVQIGEPP